MNRDDLAMLRREHRRAQHAELSALRAIAEDRHSRLQDRLDALAELTSPRFPERTRQSAEAQRRNLAEQRANLAEDAELSSLCPEERASYRPPPWRRPRADRLGEPTGDPTACELGDHVDVEGGKCLLCGEWVIGS